MTRGLLVLSVALVRAWTRLYTRGLPADLRASRRQEIESDLWECQHDPARGRDPVLAASVLARWLLGAPHDVLWRAEHARATLWRPALAAAVGVLGVALVWFAVASARPVSLPALEPPRLGATPRPPPPPPPPPPPLCAPHGSRTPPDCTQF